MNSASNRTDRATGWGAGATAPLWVAALLTPTTVGWLDHVHRQDGVRVAGSAGATAEVLRDSALAMPLVALAAAVLLAAGRRRLGVPGVAGGIARGGLLGTGVAATVAALVPLHHALFGVSYHHGQALPAGQAFTRDLMLALAVALPAAFAVQAWAALAPAMPALGAGAGAVRTASRVLAAAARRVRPGRRGVAVGVGLALAFTGVTAGQAFAKGGIDPVPTGTPGTAPLATDPGNPCPAGAPAKSFDVQAIDVKIPLNRFGDNDPVGKMYALSGAISAIRSEEASQIVSVGLRDDPIQPLVIRANMGDCVTITYTNNASGGSFGVHIDGLAFAAGSSGDAVGNNASSEVPLGTSTTYRFYVPNEPTLEGAHYLHPGPGYRAAVDHGLFGALSIQPPGSTYLNPTTGAPQLSGWEADIVPAGKAAYREAVKIMHEVGNDNESVSDKNGVKVPVQDDTTGGYRAGGFALNYRSEPFRNRLLLFGKEKSHSYSSYVFGDPATPMPRGYLGDPTKFRILHAGGEKFHVYHLHGGGDRWRANPHEDTTYDYADTGLRKDPPTQSSPSNRLDAQSTGPGEAYDLQIEGGAGGVQQSAGDFLFHCHIAKHYVAGMWSVWRVFDALQADLKPLPDRIPRPAGVPATALIGKKMPDGSTLTAATLDQWIRPQLPPQGVGRNGQDASVWNWTIDPATGNYLGEPEDLTLTADSVSRYSDPAHPNRLPGDQMVGDRPVILFNPDDGRPIYPLLRTHVGKRPPFTANGHSGAPYLGENAGKAKEGAVDPWAGRADGLCPQGRQLRTFNVVAIDTPVPVTKTTTDPEGKLFVLAKNVAKVRSGQMPAEPLAIRTNIGDCAAITLTNEMPDAGAFDGYSKTTMHIHHVQFDVQGSDGVTAGFAYEHSVRPYQVEDPQLTAAANAGATTLTVSNAAKFQNGAFIGVGLGTDGIEIRQIASVNGSTLTLTKPLAKDHPAGEYAGTEFIQYRWYPDVLLDNVFWHDHVDGIHGWGHGLVGQLIVEPKGSTYHDPKTGAEVDSGTLVDIRTQNPLAAGVVNGSFRELALWQINDSDKNANSSFNLRMEPFADRAGPVADRFSSFGPNGDPNTPLPQAYPGDPVVIRTINVSPTVDTIHVQGGRFMTEFRYQDNGQPTGTLVDTIHSGISEKYTLILGGKNDPQPAGDKLYFTGNDFRTRMGAWGIVRVLPGQSSDVQPLPDNPAPATSWTAPTGSTPPATTDPGNPCPTGAPVRSFAVSSVDLGGGGGNTVTGFANAAFVPTSIAAAAKAGTARVEPLVLHAAAGDCVEVTFTNQRNPDLVDPTLPKSSFSVAKLARDAASSGVNVGYTSEQTVAPGQSRLYRYFVDSDKLGTAPIADFGADATGKDGLYGAVVVAPKGATFTDPVAGTVRDIGSQVDVHVPGGTPYRDFTLLFADDDARMSQDFMPYPTDARPNGLGINYRAAPVGDGAGAFSSWTTGLDPQTPILKAYPGDPVLVHAVGSPGSEQTHVFNLGGLSWSWDRFLKDSQKLSSQALGPWETVDAQIAGGAGGWGKGVGDYFYGDQRRPFTQQGMWGLQRVLPLASCQLRLLNGGGCNPNPGNPTISGISPLSARVGDTVTITGTGFTTATGVTFHGALPVTPTVVSDEELRVQVPADAGTGLVQVTNSTSTVTSAAAFTLLPPPLPVPTVGALTPGSGPVGTQVTITGTNLSTASAVTFGGVPAAFSATSDTQILATVPVGAVTGSVVVSAPGGDAAAPTSFTVTVPAKPVISALSPASGPVGTAVTITGTNFNGTTAVAFNGRPATFTVLSATSIATAVPAGATTGPVSVTTTAGSTAGLSFTVTATPVPVPTISSFSPAKGPTGTKVTINGTNFVKVSKVTVAFVNCPTFTVVSKTKIVVTIPSTAKTGKFRVITPGGTAVSTGKFTKT